MKNDVRKKIALALGLLIALIAGIGLFRFYSSKAGIGFGVGFGGGWGGWGRRGWGWGGGPGISFGIGTGWGPGYGYWGYGRPWGYRRWGGPIVYSRPVVYEQPVVTRRIIQEEPSTIRIQVSNHDRDDVITISSNIESITVRPGETRSLQRSGNNCEFRIHRSLQTDADDQVITECASTIIIADDESMQNHFNAKGG